MTSRHGHRPITCKKRAPVDVQRDGATRREGSLVRRFRLRPPGVFLLGLVAGFAARGLLAPEPRQHPTWSASSQRFGSDRLAQSALNDARRAAITQRAKAHLLVLGEAGEGTWVVCEKDGTVHPR